MNYAGVFVYELTSADVRRSFIKIVACKHCNTYKTIWLSDFMGCVLPCDVGKHIYEVSKNVYQIENGEQVKERINDDR